MVPFSTAGVVLLMVCLLAVLTGADAASRAGLCLGIPEGANSYIIDCITEDKCSALAKALAGIVGTSREFDVLGSLALLTGRFDSSIIRLLCANPTLGNLVRGIELDSVIGY
jgi:hypothetical protein